MKAVVRLSKQNAHRDLAWLSGIGLLFSLAYGASATAPQGCIAPISPLLDPFWISCSALFLINGWYMFRRGGEHLSRLLMVGFMGVWLIAGTLPYSVPFVRDNGLLDRVRTQEADGTWRESLRVLTYPHMPHRR